MCLQWMNLFPISIYNLSFQAISLIRNIYSCHKYYCPNYISLTAVPTPRGLLTYVLQEDRKTGEANSSVEMRTFLLFSLSFFLMVVMVMVVMVVVVDGCH